MGGRYLFIVYGGGGGGLLMAKIDVDGTVRVSKDKSDGKKSNVGAFVAETSESGQGDCQNPRQWLKI